MNSKQRRTLKRNFLNVISSIPIEHYDNGVSRSGAKRKIKKLFDKCGICALKINS